MGNRTCVHADESFYDRERGEYLMVAITENEPGYGIVGYHNDLDGLRTIVKERNRLLGLTDEDVLNIRSSSMAASRERADRHDADGKPYLAYYRNDLTMGFVWSGKSDDEVQVTREMGEPIIDTFPVRLTTWPTPDLFKEVCERWIEENVG